MIYLAKFYICAAMDKTSKKLSIRVKYLRSKGAKIGKNVRIFSDIGCSEPYLL